MRKLKVIGLKVLTLAVCCNGIAVAAIPDDVSKPHWQIDGTPGVCLLTRTTTGANPALFAIRTVPGSDRYRLIFAGAQALEISTTFAKRAQIVFDEDSSGVDAMVSGIRLPPYPDAVQAELEDASFVARLGRAVSLGIKFGKKNAVSILLAHADKVAVALNTCVAEQLVEWGADPTQFQSNGKTPVPLRKRDDWLTAEQLSKMEIKHDSSPVHAEYYLTVDVDGKIDGCRRINPNSGKDDADRWICPALGSQPLFAPARDPGGKAVRGVASFMFDIVTDAR